jgi:hypothetical protein
MRQQALGNADLPGDPASVALSRRDADERAAQLTNADAAAELLRKADTNGDEALARAVAAHSVDQVLANQVLGDPRPWLDVVNAYAGKRPSTVDPLTELVNPPPPPGLFEYVAPRPPELV